ncbi:hypothetical protein Goshw_001988, partial [Gossypium schwendimanii]|nr:hypothetical protein [Gossypium schwendimanii]
EYLQGNPLWLPYIKVPLVTLGYETSYDVFVKAHAGGVSGQAQAITLGIARALLKVSADRRSSLKKERAFDQRFKSGGEEESWSREGS